MSAPSDPNPEADGGGPVHVSVLLGETLSALAVKPGQRVVDGTVGLGGHALRLAQAAAPGGALLAMDRDPHALRRARKRLADAPVPVLYWHGSFDGMAEAVREAGWPGADAVLLDLGVSSMQLDRPERGFSFLRDGPLDMRMDPSSGMTAAEWLAWVDEAELARVVHEYGDEPRAAKIARKIVAERRHEPIITTRRLALAVAAALPGPRGRRHPATKTFQAIRMAVNDELGALERGLDAARGILAPDGRLAVITFHSGEDRRVKHRFAEWERLGWCARVHDKVVEPGEAECRGNPRARSAKLRAIRRLY